MDHPFIRIENLSYTYNAQTDAPIPALRQINLTIARGEYLSIVGHNGSGKSTLAKCLNGLLIPTEGEVLIDGQPTRNEDALIPIRTQVGMVFQNPDNQFVTTVVEDEVAFGPENLGVPRDELRRRVDDALIATHLWEWRKHSPRHLSAGQKARLAIAATLAMAPDCLVLDESTAMLDPVSRRNVLALLQTLHQDGLAIVAITHFMEEVVPADRVIVMERGQIALQGTPRDVFAQHETLDRLGLNLPPAAAIARGLRQRGIDLPPGLLTTQELVRHLTQGKGAGA